MVVVSWSATDTMVVTRSATVAIVVTRSAHKIKSKGDRIRVRVSDWMWATMKATEIGRAHV